MSVQMKIWTGERGKTRDLCCVVISSTFSLLFLIVSDCQRTGQEIFRSQIEERKERRVTGDHSIGREEKHSGSGRDDRVQEATEEGEIEWRFQ